MLSVWEEAGRLPVVAERPYEELLLTYRPSVIKTKEENERALQILSEILSKGGEIPVRPSAGL